MIKTFNLNKIFQDKKKGEIRAADNVNIECKPGKIFGLLGLNGAGKTTLMRLLSTVLKPTSGTAKVNGFDILTDSQKVKASIGFLSSDTALYPRLTAEETVTYFARLNGIEEEIIQKILENIFKIFDMENFRDRRVDKLSSGMKQKVSLARTIIHDPEVLILDEPTLGLDVITSKNIIQFIRRAKEENKCVLFSTHIMHEAEKLCDEIAIIHNGKILAAGTLGELQNRARLKDLDEVFIKLVGSLNEF
ncbi:MAG: ATP-binding cassette domain-containing protein [candidate division Zixibacteria bacterium]|nr:ATP-binding cassette domain-containing protein [candidate division Zixibacteria bacterium]